MKRLALVLAAAVLGTGCVVATEEPTGDATFTWRFQDLDLNLAGNFTAGNTGCGMAGITEVDLEVFAGASRVFFHTYPCEEAGTGLPRGSVVGLLEGGYDYRLTGYRFNSAVFEALGGFTAISGSPAYVEATLDVLTPIPLTLYYTQNGTYSCAGTPSVYYAVYTSSSLATPVSSATIPCDPAAFGFSLPSDLPVGNYWLDFMQLLDGGGFSQWEQCSVGLRHGGFPLIVDLSAAPALSCP